MENIPGYIRFLGPTVEAQYELAMRSIGKTDIVAPDTIYIDPESDLAQAVKAGTFIFGELDGLQPDGSAIRQTFADEYWVYIFRTGKDNGLVWCRLPKL